MSNVMPPQSHQLIEMLELVARRAAYAAVARNRITSDPLRQHLQQLLISPPGHKSSFLADPVFEAAFGWTLAEQKLQRLGEDGFFTEELIEALNRTKPADPDNRDETYTFPSDRHPFTHQLQAWRHLKDSEARSVLISSGTGSGKTECFLLPLLDELLRQRSKIGHLTGVQAILLYPLNALISSQKDRLADWTASFGGDIRFCLYNGDLEDTKQKSDQDRQPYQVLSRAVLRRDPPPILVTNATMLEYMLVRAVDAPILEHSKGKLRWIILDEAHTYIGSQAAEMALLLRRVLQGFAVRNDQVRFVATSATLGERGDTLHKLRRFLADLAGVPESHVHVVTGSQQAPTLHNRPTENAEFDALAMDPAARAIRERLVQGPTTLTELTSIAYGKEAAFNHDRRHAVLDLLERGTQAFGPHHTLGQPNQRVAFLPIRVHLFQRAHAGIWGCLNPQCPGKQNTALTDPSWPYGSVYERECTRCDTCGAPVFEIVACDDCGVSFLQAAERLASGVLEPWRDEQKLDEFSQDVEDIEGDAVEDAEDEQDGGSGPRDRVLIGPPNFPNARVLPIDLESSRILDVAPPTVLRWGLYGAAECPACGASSATRPHLLRSLRLGGPFMVGTAVNTLLDFAKPIEHVSKPVPYEGRQLITFTDNRQGTARFAAKLQQEAERNSVRAAIYHAMQSALTRDSSAVVESLRTELGALLALPPSVRTTVQSTVDRLQREIEQAQAGPKPVPWSELRTTLVAHNQDQPGLIDIWKDRDARFERSEELAELQLFAEFLRRPKRANSAETLGLASLRFHKIDTLGDDDVPDLLRNRGASLADWQDFLYLVVTRFIRENSIVHIDDGIRYWVGQRVYPRSVYAPSYDGPIQGRTLRWPAVRRASTLGVLIRLLQQAFGLDLEDAVQREQVNETLAHAYSILSGLRQEGHNEFRLNLRLANFVPAEEAWLCPITGRILDRTFRGLTPYLPIVPTGRSVVCERISLPRLPFPWLRNGVGQPVALREVQAWLKDDPRIADLRRRGIWTDLHDRIVRLSPFIRAVEHSAQQPSWRLRSYERDFRHGAINVLNCSTTMEMGVDIGSVGIVAMTNVPPSAANYRQRVGRAGRRGQTLSVSYTYCPDTPLGWSVFDRPLWPFDQAIEPPAVSLDSAPIVQRHVNAYLLGQFLRDNAQDLPNERTSLTAGWFFGEIESLENAPWKRFIKWCDEIASRSPEIGAAVSTIVARTCLEGQYGLIDRTVNALQELAAEWLRERMALAEDLSALSARDPARKAIELQLRRIDGEFLLSELVRGGFFPGHGFPTDVVPFVAISPEDLRETRREHREDARTRARSYPSRTLDIAIRDYAPGSDVVIDGLVYRSAGITLNWKRPASDSDAVEIQSFGWAWSCKRCGATDSTPRQPEQCTSCGTSDLRRYRYLRPAGFTTDSEEPVHNDVDKVSFVPPVAPWISAGDASWTSLPNPQLGRARASRQGHVFHFSLGGQGFGYAVCLECGRAEQETAEPEANPEVPKALQSHRPLRRRKGGAIRCGGAEKPYGIQRHLALGFARTTDVFELQLFELRDETIARSIAIALREALAREIGIDAGELGWNSVRMPIPGGGSCYSILLFDNASGGAGYAPTANVLVPILLNYARRILDCRNPGCEMACPACLLSSDTVLRSEQLDRKRALTFLDEAVLPHLVLPAAAQVFGEHKSHSETAPLDVAIDRSMGAAEDTVLTAYCWGDPDDWDFVSWWMAPLLEKWGHRAHTIIITMSGTDFSTLDFSQRVALKGLLDRVGPKARLRIGPNCPPVPGLIATTHSRVGALGWALAPNSGVQSRPLGVEMPAAIVRGAFEIAEADGRVIAPTDLLADLAPRTFRLDVHDTLNGPINTFGHRLWQEIRALSPDVQKLLTEASGLAGVEYSDRYLVSPLCVRFLYEVACGLVAQSEGQRIPRITIRTLSQRAEIRRMSRMLHDDWPTIEQRDYVLRRALEKAATEVELRTAQIRDLPHGRIMRLSFAGKRALDIQFDQGFGHWQTQRPISFSFAAPSDRQLYELLSTNPMIVGRGGQFTTIYVTVGD